MKYIPLDILVAEIERRKKYYENLQMIKPVYESNIEDLNELLSFLDTLEAKEINSKDDLIEKVCNLLSRMVWEVTYEDLEGDSVEHYDKTEFIEEIRKYLESKL